MTNIEQLTIEKKIENNIEIPQENQKISKNNEEDLKSKTIIVKENNNNNDILKKENNDFSISKSMNKFDYNKLNIIKEVNNLQIETIDKIDKSTIRTDKKKIKIKTVIRKHAQKSEPIQEKMDLVIKENKEIENDFDGISEEGSFVMVKKDGKFLIDDKEQKLLIKQSQLNYQKKLLKEGKHIEYSDD